MCIQDRFGYRGFGGNDEDVDHVRPDDPRAIPNPEAAQVAGGFLASNTP